MRITRIVADAREATSEIPEILRRRGLYVQTKTLDIGDYVVGEYAVERKTVHDFIGSLYSGRLFEQARRISISYKNYLLVVEGDVQESLMDLRNPKVYWGTILALALTFGFRILFTLDREQTADLLQVLASKSYGGSKRSTPMLVKKPRMGTVGDWQMSIVESLPAIGPKFGERLLRGFGSVRRVFQASSAELTVKGGIGLAKARRIQEILDAEYGKRTARQAKLS